MSPELFRGGKAIQGIESLITHHSVKMAFPVQVPLPTEDQEMLQGDFKTVTHPCFLLTHVQLDVSLLTPQSPSSVSLCCRSPILSFRSVTTCPAPALVTGGEVDSSQQAVMWDSRFMKRG